MSFPGIADNEPAVKPKLPGALQVVQPTIQPGNSVAPAPNIPSQAPPNVDGGAASFSDITQSIKDLVAAKTSELAAGAQAFKANTSVDASAAAQMTGIQNSTLAAYDNIQKANSLPGGADGKIAHIIGLFDSDYNLAHQTIAVKQNELRANQIAATAASLKAQNNALPALMGKVSEAQKVIFDAQKDANQLAISKGELDDKHMNTQMSFVRLGIEQGKDARDKAEFPYRLQQAKLNVAAAQLALQKGNREEYEASTVTAMSHLPVPQLSAMVAQAQSAGSSFIAFPTGKIDPKTKQPEVMQVPVLLAQKGIIQGQETQAKVNEFAAADMTNRSNIIPDVTNLSNAANAAASFNPQAGQLTVQLGSIMAGLDPKNPASVWQTGLAIKPIKAAMADIYKKEAMKFSTPEAKNAIIAYGDSGHFDSEGAGAVVVASAGNPSLANPVHSKFGDAWAQFNQDVATEISAQHAGGTMGISSQQAGGANALDAAAIIASMSSSQGKEKIAAIAGNILADPTKVRQYSHLISGVLRADVLKNAIHLLASQKNADPIWGNILNDKTGAFDNKDGQFDTATMFDKFEQARATSGGKLDYSATLLGALRAYGMNADNAPSGDSAYTMQDHAFVSRLFGDNPLNRVASDLHWQLRQVAEEKRKQMAARIQADVTGDTQKQALIQQSRASGGLDSIPGNFNFNFDNQKSNNKIYDKLGFDANAVPSATGTGLTAAQIKAMFPGGYN